MGSSQADRAVDDPNLAVRLGHRGICLLDALQMVSSRNVARRCSAATAADRNANTRQNLAYGNDLMFDHAMRVGARAKNLWSLLRRSMSRPKRAN